MANETDFRTVDFSAKPHTVVWEPTKACDVACTSCRASVQAGRDALELSTFECYKLIDQIAALEPQSFVITGGDPLKRADIFELIEYACRRGLEPALTPSATPLLTHAAIRKMKDAGVARIGLGLDGSTAAVHDRYRGIPGSFDLTLDCIRYAVGVGIPVQVSTTITRHNSKDVDAMIRMLDKLGIDVWSVYFLVPTARVTREEMITGPEADAIFETLYQARRRVTFAIQTMEAGHYRRFLVKKIEQEKAASGGTFDPACPVTDLAAIALRDIHTPHANEARGLLFVSHVGEVYPSTLLPVSGGNVRKQQLADIYRRSPFFIDFRDITSLHGKCGSCDYKRICGGSRARAFAISGDPFDQEPLCTYTPPGWKE